MNPDMVAGLLKHFYPSFSMDSFDGRLKLQKIVYLLQAYGLNIGYHFNLYLYGPYSTELARDGFAIGDFEKAPKMEFSRPTSQQKFVDFIHFIGNRKDDAEWLEIAASLHILKSQGYNDADAIKFVKGKHNGVFAEKEDRITEILGEIRHEGMIA
jgi:uncharacterized protein YwgA